MPQTVLSVVLEVEPRSTGRIATLVEAWRAQEGQGPGADYSQLMALVPSLHFMSITIFRDQHFDPILVLEANFDGDPGPFWAELEGGYGARLRDIVRCCKRPPDESGLLFDDVTRLGSERPLAPYLEAKTQRPAVFHQGNRGLDRARIQREAALFLAARQALAEPGIYAGASAHQIHATLRQTLLPAFPWLAQPQPVRIATAERLRDAAGLVGFLALAVFCLSVPGIALAQATHAGRFSLGILVAGGLAGTAVWGMRAALAGQGAPRESGALQPSRAKKLSSLANPFTLAVAMLAFLALYLTAGSWTLAVVFWPLAAAPFDTVWHASARALALGLVSLLATVPLILLWLRILERRDSSQDDPVIAPDALRALARREDHIAQNHMGSVVLIKPGLLRMALIRTGLFGLGLILRVVATSGYLGSMRTIHFAHWATVNNASRLLFFSNFDGSWESYLDDFIEKAHGGLSLAWGCCTGFPPGRFLVMDGASHGRRFKAWARQSQTESLLWFSAYPNLSVNQIERQAALADGLRRPALSQKEAAAWVRTL